MGKIHIGTSGWAYDDWADGVFYPPDLSNRDWLKFYSQTFTTVEINATFYHQMPAKIYAGWRQQVPKNFIFSVKASRFLTHVKKLNDPFEPWRRFIANAAELKEKLGPALVQLPPNLHFDIGKLNNLTKAIRAGNKIIRRRLLVALEVRHQSWFNEAVYKVLKKHNIALVFSYGEGLPVAEVITADWLYLRLHGPAGLYGSKYTVGQLKKLAAKIKAWRRRAKDIFVYFNNDTAGYAVSNARQLKDLLS